MANTSLGLWFTWCDMNGPVYCFRIGPENNHQNDEDENNANNDINSNDDNDGNNNENENRIHMDAAQEMENV